MMHDLIANILILIFSLTLWWMWFFVWRDYRVDRLRQRLFSIRDELFDSFAENDPKLFNAKGYTITRTTLNGMIRFAHDLTLFRIMLSVIVHIILKDKNNNLANDYITDLDKSLSALNDNAANKIAKAQLDMHLAVAKHIVRGSLPLLVLAIIFKPFGKALQFYNHIARGEKSRRRWAWVDAEANVIGHDQLATH